MSGPSRPQQEREQVALPIDALLPEILDHLKRNRNLVIEAAPGAGKTTRVPPALLQLVSGQVLVLEPRRLAARMAAVRTAAELGESVGETVGYQVRFDDVTGPKTRLRFVTEGVLTRRMLSDPELRGVDAIVLDEFHERHLETDLALALLRRLQQRRPELYLVVMSATLDAAPVATYLHHCPVLRSEGRSYPLTIRHQPYSPLPLERQVRGAVIQLLGEGQQGHILAFLPGAAEIRRALRECESALRSADLALLPLYGDLSPEEQDRAVAPSRRQKVIFATNVAESSVTIDGVTAVVDSGLARFASYSPWTGLPTLEVGRISKASAAQRAGRAGRTGPGQALRLYAQEDLAQRAAFDLPEILRSDLSGLCLSLRAMGFGSAYDLDWLDPPLPEAVQHAEDLLDRLGMEMEKAGQYARLPLPPRISRLTREAASRGVGIDGVKLAALLGARSKSSAGDILALLDKPLDEGTERHWRQLTRLLRPEEQQAHNEEALQIAVLSGFPDRVARLRAGKQISLANGTSAELGGERAPYEFMVVLDVEDRKDRQMPVARLVSHIEPEWLLDLFPERVREENRLEWNRESERVDVVSHLRYDELVLQSSTNMRPEPGPAAALLAAKAMDAGLDRFVDAPALDELLARVAFAELPSPDLGALLQELCIGLRSFAELRTAAQSFLPMLEQQAGTELRQAAPATLRLPSTRLAKIHYELGKPPWVESRLQDFFGMAETPRIGRNKAAVVVHLLAPNHRAVQTTTDLSGFWDRLYPQVRKELMRRYPRHAWPEDPKAPYTIPAKRS